MSANQFRQFAKEKEMTNKPDKCKMSYNQLYNRYYNLSFTLTAMNMTACLACLFSYRRGLIIALANLYKNYPPP